MTGYLLSWQCECVCMCVCGGRGGLQLVSDGASETLLKMQVHYKLNPSYLNKTFMQLQHECQHTQQQCFIL